ncbi:hypothetical protein GZH47_00555 [Paenibacillus rhizovicinus]|uniref:XdhC family protein n=1 Tax=Paenibacillus rhizovicinus TaxID=2704463 RepID=A0A6C0NTI9_9BACL|nr:XdhC/CoxI family protein [Paenibacillus rhizovicinus]QHW29468.1 hypothetical protein GZH47_00555 [Paenibacillus rhizovicinus]
MESERISAFADKDSAAAVLATIIQVRGHSYRKEGASMLLTEDGRRIGSISPGCLEADLHARVAAILEAGVHEVANYNMRPEEDVVWGEEIGCGGEIRILLEPLTGTLRGLLREIGRRVRCGERVKLVRREAGGILRYWLEPAGARSESAADSAGAVAERMSRHGEESRAETEGAAAVTASGHGAEELEADGALPFFVPASGREVKERETEGALLFATVFAPRDRLVIFGARDEAVAVGELARGIGFETVVADWRPELCRPGRFPHAATFVGEPERIVAELQIGERDFVMIGSHHLRRDREMAALVMPLRPAYLGIVGSARRIKLVLDGMAPEPFVKAPIGLAIGAEGAEEIAVSVAAELIGWRKRLRSSAFERRNA